MTKLTIGEHSTYIMERGLHYKDILNSPDNLAALSIEFAELTGQESVFSKDSDKFYDALSKQLLLLEEKGCK